MMFGVRRDAAGHKREEHKRRREDADARSADHVPTVSALLILFGEFYGSPIACPDAHAQLTSPKQFIVPKLFDTIGDRLDLRVRRPALGCPSIRVATTASAFSCGEVSNLISTGLLS